VPIRQQDVCGRGSALSAVKPILEVFFTEKLMRCAPILAFAVVVLAACSVARADSSVTFSGSPSTSWADGTFSTDLSGDFPDGFYGLPFNSAYNAYGQNGEYINFNGPVELESLQLEGGNTEGCCTVDPSTITVLLYDSADNLLASETAPGSSLDTLTFDTSGVSKVVFDFTGGDANLYGDGRTVAWYVVSNVDYGPSSSPVPEPSSLLLLGSGLLGIVGLRRRM
jgi:hypothetical protein